MNNTAEYVKAPKVTKSPKNANVPFSCLNVDFLNIRSLMNKILFVNDYLKSNDTDLLFLTETWLRPDISSSLFCPSGYNVLRNDRQSSKGGGVLLLYKSSLNLKEVTLNFSNSTTCSNFEFVCADVLLESNSTARFMCFYIPPSYSGQIDTISKCCDIITCAIPFASPIYIMGDFNLPAIDWEIPVSKGGPSHDYFVDFCIENSLTQCVQESTHNKGNMLDLVLCNHLAYNQLLQCLVNPPLTSKCDHNSVSLKVEVKQSINDYKKIALSKF